MPKQYHAERLWDGENWLADAQIVVDDDGNVVTVEPNQVATDEQILSGAVIPALVNGHSHAFQRAMVGRAEQRVGDDDFWRWRESMYGLALQLTPEQQANIAAQLYLEMIKSGYTQVCEFHYLHNDIDGQPYAELSLTSQHLLDAAQQIGLGITLLPVLYQHQGFTLDTPSETQRRFVLDAEQYLALLASLQNRLSPLDRLGAAFHSLRAVRAHTIARLLPKLPSGPLHIHISEQTAEVHACLEHYGQRPIEHLADNVMLDDRWSLIHATHASDRELALVTEAGATVVLCPGTEANLGDGLFPVDRLLAAGGRFAIGSDSQVSINPAHELRLLEYGQRLDQQKRSVVCEDDGHCGSALWQQAARGGAHAGGVKVGQLRPGWRADWLVLDANSPRLFSMVHDELLDGVVFASENSPVQDVYVAGRKVIANGEHPQEQRVIQRFKDTMEALYRG